MTKDEHHARFDAWLTEHSAMLHHVVNGFAIGPDRADLRQELLLALWHAAPAFRGAARSSTFVYRVAHNAALTWSRSLRNYRQRIERFESLVPPSAAEPPVGGATESRELLDLLYARIHALPPVDRSLILLHLDGASYAEIAEIHGLTETNVGVRLNRLKHKLTASMQEISHELH